MPAYLTLPASVLDTRGRRHIALPLYREIRRHNWRSERRHSEEFLEALVPSDPALPAAAYGVQLLRSAYLRALEAQDPEHWHAWHAMLTSGVIAPYLRDQDRRGQPRYRRNLMTAGATPAALDVLDQLLDRSTIIRLEPLAYQIVAEARGASRLAALLERGV